MNPENSILLEISINIAIVSVSIAILVSLFRLFRGPSVIDRLIVLDLVSSSLIGLILVFIIQTSETVYLNVALITALIVFMGNVAFSRYLKRNLKND